MRQPGERSRGSLSRAVKPRDVPDTRAARAGGTNWGVLVMVLWLTLKYLLGQGQGAELEQPCSDLLQP